MAPSAPRPWSSRAAVRATLVIPAAGFGTRMRAVSGDRPKELLPVAGRASIDYAVAEGFDAGVDRVVVIIRAGKEEIREHLDARFDGLVYLHQPEQRGEMDAVALAEDAAAGGSVAVIHPDAIALPGPGALRRLLEAHSEHGTEVSALTPMDPDAATAMGNSGRVDLEPLRGELYRILRYLPKGPGSFEPRFPGEPRACGLKVFSPDLFDVIRRARLKLSVGQELTDGPVQALLLERRPALGLLLRGRVFDAGNPAGYALACEVAELAAENRDLDARWRARDRALGS